MTLGDHLGDDSRYATFSAIKGVVYTATWQLLAEGSLRLDQPVADVIPEFGADDSLVQPDFDDYRILIRALPTFACLAVRTAWPSS